MRSERLFAAPPPQWQIPNNWRAQFYEEVVWPSPDTEEESGHPFRFFLEITRGRIRPAKFPVHVLEEQWQGPPAKAWRIRKFLRFAGGNPEPFPRRVATYLVYSSEMSTLSLCRWLSLLLAQRVFVTVDEEDQLIRAFFAKADSSEWEEAKHRAYMVCKRNFVQPIQGHLSFPSYWNNTVRHELKGVLTEEPSAASSPDRLSLAGQVTIPLKILRKSEPNLHRAVLDRIHKGRISTQAQQGELYVSVADVDRIDVERRANRVARQPNRLSDRGQRHEWLIRIAATQGLAYASARRKLARWINDYHLTAEQIEASIIRGRVVRRPH